MKVLVACEFSGIVRDAFIARGHEAVSCDLHPSINGGPHVQGDVLLELEKNWDILIAHPPCTFLANSGVRWLKDSCKRWEDMVAGALFFNRFLTSSIPKICVENPIMHKYAKSLIKQDYTQIIQPWQFGYFESKATCLWLKGLSPLTPTKLVEPFLGSRIHKLAKTTGRQAIRSITYPNIARAMAEQWG